jgi:DNA repair protein RecO
MKENKCMGIVLKSYAFKETERIIHLFTEEQGIIHLIVKRLSPKQTAKINLTTPLCFGEYVYRKGKSDLYTLIDGTILNLHLPLRQSLQTLMIGAKMLETIHSSQFPENPTPRLYHLLLAYLKKLSLAPETMWTSFQLKFLKHEGHISYIKPYIHSSEGSLEISSEDWPYFLLLLEGRDFSTLTSFSPPSTLQKQIETLFSSFIKQSFDV